MIIGFIVYGIIILVGPITGASLNPARELGPALLGQAIGATPVPIDQLVVVYIFGSTIGGVVGAFLYEFIGRPQTATMPAAAIAEPARADA
jgi:glycerol uptake facilitator protein